MAGKGGKKEKRTRENRSGQVVNHPYSLSLDPGSSVNTLESLSVFLQSPWPVAPSADHDKSAVKMYWNASLHRQGGGLFE